MRNVGIRKIRVSCGVVGRHQLVQVHLDVGTQLR
jgi:hypothetical protein